MRNKDLLGRHGEIDTTRLPKKVQTLIDLLDMRLAEQRRANEQLRGAVTPETKVIADVYAAHDGESIPLRENTTVRFITGDRNKGEYVDVHLSDDGRVRIATGNTMAVYPGGSNTIYVKSDR